MNDSVDNEVTVLGKKTKRNRQWKRIVSLLACVVVLCTTYALILPAITLEAALTQKNTASTNQAAEQTPEQIPEQTPEQTPMPTTKTEQRVLETEVHTSGGVRNLEGVRVSVSGILPQGGGCALALSLQRLLLKTPRYCLP